MHLNHPFYKFPFLFDVAQLRAEVEAMPETAWRSHHEGFEGNSALTLITTNGTDNDDVLSPMLPTEHLNRSPYLQQVLGAFRTLHGRARLMRLAPHAGVPPHVDIQYYWRARARVHIPIVTHPDIKFRCGGEIVHMAAGEAWTFDNWRPHQVINETPTRRVHLTFDTFGSPAFWNMARPHEEVTPNLPVPYRPTEKTVLTYESYPGDPVMPPGEVDYELSRLATDVVARSENDPNAAQHFIALLAALRGEWRLLWHAKGPVEASVPLFQRLLAQFERQCTESVPASLLLASNGKGALEVLLADLTAMVKTPAAAKTASSPAVVVPRFERPVFVVSAPRAGAGMLFEAMAASEALWTLGTQDAPPIAALDARHRDFASDRLIAANATKDAVTELGKVYAENLRRADGTRHAGMGTAAPRAIRFLQRTPVDALRIPFLKTVFPEAKFIFLHREAGPNISASLEAWRSGRFVTYPDLPGWTGPAWSLPLIPGWRELSGADVGVIAARQWRDTNEIILADLAKLPKADWCSVRTEDIVDDPETSLTALFRFAELPFGETMRALTQAPLRWSRQTLSPPDPGKWRKNEAALTPVLQGVQETVAKLAAL